MEIKLGRFHEEIFFTTVRLHRQPTEGRPASVGTGFLCRVPYDEAHHFFLLVTNRHIVDRNCGELRFSVTKQALNSDSPLVGQVHQYAITDTGAGCLEHPNPIVDLACVNVTEALTQTNRNFFRSIERPMFGTFQEPDLVAGGEVLFVGYPDGRYDQVNNLPLLRKGYIASMPQADYDGLPHFVIDAQVHPGSSGSPVFANLGGRYKMVGVITATMVKHGRLTTVPAQQTLLGVQQVLGLGIAIKATEVGVLVDAAIERVRRETQTSGPLVLSGDIATAAHAQGHEDLPAPTNDIPDISKLTAERLSAMTTAERKAPH